MALVHLSHLVEASLSSASDCASWRSSANEHFVAACTHLLPTLSLELW